jgi:Protein of unknown function (DUF3465)
MLKNNFLILLLTILVAACGSPPNTASAAKVESPVVASVNPIATVDSAYANRVSNISVEGQGVVVKILADDNNGLRHQKFLVKVASGKTLLFAHNIDLAPRVEDINIGDTVEFRGEYVFNPKGGVVHWTHKDPRGEHAAGWIKHNGRTYE